MPVVQGVDVRQLHADIGAYFLFDRACCEDDSLKTFRLCSGAMNAAKSLLQVLFRVTWRNERNARSVSDGVVE